MPALSDSTNGQEPWNLSAVHAPIDSAKMCVNLDLDQEPALSIQIYVPDKLWRALRAS